MALGVAREQTSGGGQRAVMAQRSENVQHFPFLRQRVAHAVCRQQRQARASRDFERGLVARLFFARKMALQFDVHIAAAKKFREPLNAGDSARDSSVRQRVRQRTFVAARKANQARGIADKFLLVHVAFVFWRAQFHARDQAANVLVSFARRHQQRIAPAIGRGDLRADMRPHGKLLGGQIKSRRAIHAVAIEQRHGAHFMLGAFPGQRFGQRSAFQKTEGGARVQFDVLQS